MLVVTFASSVRLLNSLTAPARAAKVRVALMASWIVTALVPVTQEAEVDKLVQVPFTVQTDPPRSTNDVAVKIVTFPVTVTTEFRARKLL
jgi:hypothetical protein